MPHVVGIRFKDSGKIYFFDPNGFDLLAQGDQVVVETVRGLELAKVADAPRDVDQSEIVGELKPVVRRAEQTDFERLQTLNESHAEVLQRCMEKVEEHNLPMRLVKAEYSFDGSRLTFYFTAEKRVDFRALVRDLARTFRARIELRQIGPRDEAKLLGGIGPCGRLLCCATFLPDYAHVSIKMAKDQDLPLNPIKISGVCGRLLCCLSYEHEQYLEIKQELPRRGMWVQTPDGPGEVVAVNVVRETVTVELAGSGVQEEFKPSQLQEATRKVGEEARRRNDEGITPAAHLERSGPRPPRDRGERRFLRDEIESPDILDALAMFEENVDEPSSRETPREQRGGQPRQRPAGKPQQSQPEEARASTARRAPPPRRRQRGGRPTNPQAQPPKNDMPQPPDAAPEQRASDKSGPRRRRRRGGRSGGNVE